MVKTSDKIILGVLIVIMIGLNGFLITAMNSDDASSVVSAESASHITQDEAKVIALNAVPYSSHMFTFSSWFIIASVI